MDGEVFQKSISANKPNTWLMGENSLKKLPGLTALKYSLAVAMKLGRSLPDSVGKHSGQSLCYIVNLKRSQLCITIKFVDR